MPVRSQERQLRNSIVAIRVESVFPGKMLSSKWASSSIGMDWVDNWPEVSFREFFIDADNKQTIWGASYEESDHHLASSASSTQLQTTNHSTFRQSTIRNETMHNETAMDVSIVVPNRANNAQYSPHDKENICVMATSMVMSTSCIPVASETRSNAVKAKPSMFQSLLLKRQPVETHDMSIEMGNNQTRNGASVSVIAHTKCDESSFVQPNPNRTIRGHAALDMSTQNLDKSVKQPFQEVFTAIYQCCSLKTYRIFVPDSVPQRHVTVNAHRKSHEDNPKKKRNKCGKRANGPWLTKKMSRFLMISAEPSS